jgi:endogenous inhibitor of DNA gyrase (YacG/DUF329 family)
MEIQETITFNGSEYRLMGARKYYLSQAKITSERKGAKGLHVAIWEFHNGKSVPEGFCIHHKNGNTFNNDIGNLECIPIKKHLSDHAHKNMQNPEYVKKNRNSLDVAREKASEWHRSEEGRKWHSENSKNCIRKEKKLICQSCGKEFESVFSDTRFCSNKCGERYRRKYNGVKYTRKCNYCGNEFTATKRNESKPDNKFCSTKCASDNRYHPKTEL